MSHRADTPPLPLAAGLIGRCPRCGEGRLFRGFLALRSRCEQCGLDFSFADSADGPAFFVMFFCRLYCRRVGIGGGSPLCATILGSRAAMGPADTPDDTRTFAPAQGTSDRAAILSQGGGEPCYRRRCAVKGAPARQLRSGLVLPALFALAAIVTFIGLGTWQVQRKAWKEALIESFEQRLSAPPVDLPSRERWQSSIRQRTNSGT